MEAKRQMFKQKFTLVTGAGGFLGIHHCRAVLEAQNSLIMIDKNLHSLSKSKKIILKEFKKKTSTILSYKIDITLENEVKKLKSKLKRKKIIIDSIINNAAIDSVPKKNKGKYNYISPKQWKMEIDVSLLGTYLITENFKEFLLKNKYSSVINIGSDLSIIAPNQEIYKKSFGNYIKPITYSVAKHGLLGITKYYASLYAKKNVRFNMISPGPIYKNQKKNFVNELKYQIPMKRLGNPEDLKGVIKFLLSKSSSFITGQNILVDGGRTII